MSLIKNFSMPTPHFTSKLNKFARTMDAPEVYIHRIDDTHARIDIGQRVEALVRRTVAGVRVQVAGGTYDTNLNKLEFAIFNRVIADIPLAESLADNSAVVGVQ